MKLLRISVAKMMLGIVFIAISLAALRFPSPLAANGFYTLALTLLATSLLGVVYSRVRRRAYLAGFAVFGWGYFLLIFAPLPDQIDLENRLFTTALLDLAHSSRAFEPRDLVGPSPDPILMPLSPNTSEENLTSQPLVIESNMPSQPTTPPVNRPIGFRSAWTEWSQASNEAETGYWDGNAPHSSSIVFRAIGHCLWTILFALIGGAIARRFYDTRDHVSA